MANLIYLAKQYLFSLFSLFSCLVYIYMYIYVYNLYLYIYSYIYISLRIIMDHGSLFYFFTTAPQLELELRLFRREAQLNEAKCGGRCFPSSLQRPGGISTWLKKVIQFWRPETHQKLLARTRKEMQKKLPRGFPV
jgi:hypothetical protein